MIILLEKKCISNQFKFIYREFIEHRCYPFSINQLFNRNVNQLLGRKCSIKQKIFRIENNNDTQVIIFPIKLIYLTFIFKDF